MSEWITFGRILPKSRRYAAILSRAKLSQLAEPFGSHY